MVDRWCGNIGLGLTVSLSPLLAGVRLGQGEDEGVTLGHLLETLRMREHEIAVGRLALGCTAPKLPGGSLLERRTQPEREGHIVEKHGEGASVDLRSDGSRSEQDSARRRRAVRTPPCLSTRVRGPMRGSRVTCPSVQNVS